MGSLSDAFDKARNVIEAGLFLKLVNKTESIGGSRQEKRPLPVSRSRRRQYENRAIYMQAAKSGRSVLRRPARPKILTRSTGMLGV
jgi:hypothetical protein